MRSRSKPCQQGERHNSVMGCCYGKNGLSALVDRATSGKKHEGSGKKKYLPQPSLDASSSQTLRGLPEQRPEFTDEQKRIVLESWNVIQKDIARVGVVMFVG
nr:hypothetical protein BaRGS_012540 [Batillaria attramentaria]